MALIGPDLQRLGQLTGGLPWYLRINSAPSSAPATTPQGASGGSGIPFYRGLDPTTVMGGDEDHGGLNRGDVTFNIQQQEHGSPLRRVSDGQGGYKLVLVPTTGYQGESGGGGASTGGPGSAPDTGTQEATASNIGSMIGNGLSVASLGISQAPSMIGAVGRGVKAAIQGKDPLAAAFTNPLSSFIAHGLYAIGVPDPALDVEAGLSEAAAEQASGMTAQGMAEGVNADAGIGGGGGMAGADPGASTGAPSADTDGGMAGDSPGSPAGDSAGDGGSAGAGGCFVYTELRRQGLITKRDVTAVLLFHIRLQRPRDYEGYLLWSLPMSRHMRRHPRLTRALWHPIAMTYLERKRWRLKLRKTKPRGALIERLWDGVNFIAGWVRGLRADAVPQGKAEGGVR